MAGCEHTPKSLQDEGERTVHQLRRPPSLAAGCLARNIENHRNGYAANVRALDEKGGHEVIVRWSGTITIAIAQVQPSPSGSEAAIWLRPEWFYRRSEFIPAMIADC